MKVSFNEPLIKTPPTAMDCLSQINRIITLFNQSSGTGDSLEQKLNLNENIEIFTKVKQKVERADFTLTASSVFEKMKKDLISFNETLRLFLMSPDETNLGNIYETQELILETIPKIQSRLFRNTTNEEANSLLVQANEATSELLEFKTKAQVDSAEIGNLKIEGERLVQLLAGKTLNDSYEKRAIKEKESADKWTKATWVFAVTTIISLLLTYFWQFYVSATSSGQIPAETAINYQLLSTKVLFTLTLGLIAKWTSKRANRHLMEESKYHRLAVNMATISAFIAPLEKEQQSTVLSAIALKIFADESGNEAPTDYETANALELAKSLFSRLEK